jgi:hypothetical protein
MQPFACLRPHVTQDEALAAFQRRALRFLARLPLPSSAGRGSLREIADVYVPYHLFRVEITNRARHETAYFALDAVRGMLDLYQFHFEHGTEDLDLVTVESRNRIPATLGVAEASETITDAVRRILFLRGVYRLHTPRLAVHREPVDLHVPYYLGFYGESNGAVARLRVLDAVRRRFEGAKARALFEAWLAS